MTDRQKEVFEYVRTYCVSRGHSPLMRDIAQHLSISVVVAFQHVTALRRKGWLTSSNGLHRTLRPTNMGGTNGVSH